jgi:hypothetical protein
MALYSLERIQASVARKDSQGKKINKLRKSYENQVKAYGLPGKTKPLGGMPENALLGLLDPAWDFIDPNGVPQWQIQRHQLTLGDQVQPNLLDAALGGMKEGRLPKDEYKKWDEIIGLSDSRPVAPGQAAVKPGQAAPNPLLSKTAPALSARASAPSSPRASLSRPERAGKKRRYDESSYTGYQEGYADDDGGYSTGGDSASGRGSVSKRPRLSTDGTSSVGRPPKTRVGA